MARKRGKKGKRGSRITFGPKGQVRRERKPSKQQKFISKISRDGKISKKEGRKAAKKGISLNKIQNRRISEYRKATRDFESRGMKARGRTPGARGPSYEPLKIKRGAERADFARQMRDYEQRGGGRTRGGRQRGGRGGGRGGGRPSQQPTNQYQQEIEDILGGGPEQTVTTPGGPDPNQDYLDAIADLEATIAGLSFDAPDYSGEFEAMKAEQERLMAEMAARQAEQERQRELAFRTSQENAARGGMTADFRIGSRSPRDRMGTSGFVRRPNRRPATIAQGVNVGGIMEYAAANNFGIK